jgi:hypothetical protein
MEEKKKPSIFNFLVVLVTVSVIGLAGISILSCAFVFPGSIRNYEKINNINSPHSECETTERRGYETLLSVLTAVLALKARLDD